MKLYKIFVFSLFIFNSSSVLNIIFFIAYLFLFFGHSIQYIFPKVPSPICFIISKSSGIKFSSGSISIILLFSFSSSNNFRIFSFFVKLKLLSYLPLKLEVLVIFLEKLLLFKGTLLKLILFILICKLRLIFLSLFGIPLIFFELPLFPFKIEYLSKLFFNNFLL